MLLKFRDGIYSKYIERCNLIGGSCWDINGNSGTVWLASEFFKFYRRVGNALKSFTKIRKLFAHKNFV